MKTVGALAALGLLMTVSAAQAQAPQAPICGPSAALAKRLLDKHEEAPRAFGIMPDGNMFQVYASKSGGWTAVVAQPNGVSCVVGAGNSWTHVLPPPDGPLV